MKLLRTLAIGASVAIALTAATAVPASAADGLDPGNEIDGGDYTITLKPDSAELKTPPDTIAISKGCPEGYREMSMTTMYGHDNGTFIGAISDARTLDTQDYSEEIKAGWGLTGNPISLERTAGFNFWPDWSGWWMGATTVDLVVRCYNTPVDDDQSMAAAKYFVASLMIDAEKGTWKQVPHTGTDPAPTTPPTSGETTTEVTSSAVTATSATLTARVTPAEATGEVTFTSGDITQTAPVQNGTASVSVSGLTPETEYAFTADYSGDDDNAESSGSVTFTTKAASGSNDDSDVIVDVPPVAEAGALTLSVAPAAITLSGDEDRLPGGTWMATGATGKITVIDDRKDPDAAWSLNGEMSDLTSGDDTIEASNIGWAPEVTEGEATAGDTVTAGDGGGFSEPKTLASGQGSTEGNVVAVVAATLTLIVPPEQAGGSYKGKLTLTLS